MASVHQKHPVPNVAVSTGALPVTLSAAAELELVSELVNDIVLLGFSRCAQDGEKNANESDAANKPKKEDKVSNVRLDICSILFQIRTDIRPDLVNVFKPRGF